MSCERTQKQEREKERAPMPSSSEDRSAPIQRIREDNVEVGRRSKLQFQNKHFSIYLDYIVKFAYLHSISIIGGRGALVAFVCTRISGDAVY